MADGWVVALRDNDTHKIVLCDEETLIPEGPQIDRHVVPFTRQGGTMSFGIHDFSRTCVCRPEIESTEWGQAVVTHQERRPN